MPNRRFPASGYAADNLLRFFGWTLGDYKTFFQLFPDSLRQFQVLAVNLSQDLPFLHPLADFLSDNKSGGRVNLILFALATRPNFNCQPAYLFSLDFFKITFPG